MKTKRTDIAKLGEFGLIKHLTKNFSLRHKTTLKGVGDDCAVLDTERKKILVTTDQFVEGIHFDLTYTPWQHLGYKLVVATIADIYAMNGTPKQILLNIALGKNTYVEDLEEFYLGVQLAQETYNIDVVGGDITSSLTGLMFSLTAIGEVDEEQITYRNTAKETDLICVSNDLGAAYLGMQLLEREKVVFNSQNQQTADFQPDFSGKEYLLEKFLKPEINLQVLHLLKENKIKPTAMIDLSDGLASDVLQLCKSSEVGCKIFEERIPIDYTTALMAEELNLNVTTCALNGGEDYEMLFTLPLYEYEKIKKISQIKVIGHITAQSEGCNLVTRDGQTFGLKAQGWVEENY